MKIITLVYIFTLYILCIPGFLFKRKYSIIMHTSIFSIILLLTYDLVNGTKENLPEEKSASLEIENLDNLINNLNQKIDIEMNEIDILVNNNIEHTTVEDGNKYIQNCFEQLDILKKYKLSIEELEYKIASYRDLENSKKKLDIIVEKLTKKEEKLNKQINGLNTSIVNKNEDITARNKTITDNGLLIGKLGTDIDTTNKDINKKENTILLTKEKIDKNKQMLKNLENQIDKQKQVVASNDHEIDVLLRNMQILANTLGGKLQKIVKNKQDSTHDQKEINERNDLITEINNKKTDFQNEFNSTKKTLDATTTENKRLNTAKKNLTDSINRQNPIITNYNNKFNKNNIDNASLRKIIYNSTPNKTSCPGHWLEWMKDKCTAQKKKENQCFFQRYKTLGKFVDDHNGEGTSFSFNQVWNDGRQNYWSSSEVANSWTNQNPYVQAGQTIVPMKYVKWYV